MNNLTNATSVFSFSFSSPTHLLQFNSWHLRQRRSSTVLPSLVHISSPSLLTRLPKPLLALWLVGSEDKRSRVFYWSPSGLTPVCISALRTHTSHTVSSWALPESADSDGWHVSTWQGSGRGVSSHGIRVPLLLLFFNMSSSYTSHCRTHWCHSCLLCLLSSSVMERLAEGFYSSRFLETGLLCSIFSPPPAVQDGLLAISRLLPPPSWQPNNVYIWSILYDVKIMQNLRSPVLQCEDLFCKLKIFEVWNIKDACEQFYEKKSKTPNLNFYLQPWWPSQTPADAGCPSLPEVFLQVDDHQAEGLAGVTPLLLLHPGRQGGTRATPAMPLLLHEKADCCNSKWLSTAMTG